MRKSQGSLLEHRVGKPSVGMARHPPEDCHPIKAVYDRRQVESFIESFHLRDVGGPLLVGPVYRKVLLDAVGWGIGYLFSVGT